MTDNRSASRLDDQARGSHILEPLDRLSVAVVGVTPVGDAVFVNQAFSSLTGISRSASHRLGWAEGLDDTTRMKLLRQIRKPDGSFDCEVRSPHGTRWTRWTWHCQSKSEARVITVVDLTVDHRKQTALTRLASRDSLTGAANRRTFLEELRHALRREDYRQVGVVYADLDGFKAINDEGGHAMGDKVLQLLVRRFLRHLRPGDLLGRMGGDEFAVLCIGPPAEIMSVVERLTRALNDPFSVDGATIRVSATVGIAVASGPSDDPEVLLSRADTAMYDAKTPTGAAPRGRSTVAFPVERTNESGGLVDRPEQQR